ELCAFPRQRYKRCGAGRDGGGVVLAAGVCARQALGSRQSAIGAASRGGRWKVVTGRKTPTSAKGGQMWGTEAFSQKIKRAPRARSKNLAKSYYFSFSSFSDSGSAWPRASAAFFTSSVRRARASARFSRFCAWIFSEPSSSTKTFS